MGNQAAIINYHKCCEKAEEPQRKVIAINKGLKGSEHPDTLKRTVDIG